MVRVVRMRLVSWHEHKAVMNQEKTDEEVADEISQEVNRRRHWFVYKQIDQHGYDGTG